jgi:hypothetical protein
VFFNNLWRDCLKKMFLSRHLSRSHRSEQPRAGLLDMEATSNGQIGAFAVNKRSWYDSIRLHLPNEATPRRLFYRQGTVEGVSQRPHPYQTAFPGAPFNYRSRLLLPSVSGLSTEIEGDVSVLNHMSREERLQHSQPHASSRRLTVSVVASSNRTK